MNPSSSPTRRRFIPRSHWSIVGTGLLVLALLAFAWMLPSYRTQIATVDGASRWFENAAPPRHEFVWQTAVPVLLRSGQGIRPQVADNGNTLYFTHRNTSESVDHFDIVRSRWTDDGWSKPEPVAALNSSADDVGPVIRADGKVLYLYSRRNGGFGGMDLYESTLDGNTWSKPVNLGRSINTPADEFDPAISPDGARLFFSSNRSESLHRQWAGKAEVKLEQWSTTLRDNQIDATFDLYATERVAGANDWINVSPLALLNTSAHNEGTPFVSPDGLFLLFASDRLTARGEPVNYDIYRVRLDRADLPVENLGPAINTPANEIEPCLTAAGFQIYFSRSDAEGTSRYAFFQSSLKEVYRDGHWDYSRFNAIGSLLNRGVKGFIANVWLWLIAIVAIGILAWLIRAAKSHRLAIPGFLLAAVLIHFFLVTSSFFVFFQQAIAQKIQLLFDEELVVATSELFSSAATNAAEQPSFDSVAELQLPDPISLSEAPRQITSAPIPAQPIELDQPVRIASHLFRPDAPLEEVVVASVMVEDPTTGRVEKMPRVPAPRDSDITPLRLERTIAVSVPDVELPATKVIDAPRQSLASDSVQVVPPAAIEQNNEPGEKNRLRMLSNEAADRLAVADPLHLTPTTSLKRSLASQPGQAPDTPITTDPLKAASVAESPLAASPPLKLEVVRQAPLGSLHEIATLTVSAEPARSMPRGLTESMSRPEPAGSVLATPAPLVSSALGSRLTASTRQYADASVNLQNLLLRRKLDEAAKANIIKQFGGNDETLTSIRRGLIWIEQHQAVDGHWGLNDFHERCQGHPRCEGRGNSDSDTAGTGLALLPFLGDGNTHQQGPYKDVVARGITWLVKNQKPDGNFFTGGQGIAFLYSHAIATIAICECYNMTGDVSLRGPAQRGLDFIVASQDPRTGGWRYQPRDQSDTSVVGWQVMALKSGQMADLNVPEKTLKESRRWLDSVAGKNAQLGQFAYQAGRFTPATTAEAILCLEYLGEDRGSEPMVHGTRFLERNLPQAGRDTSYYWYYATQAMFHLQGEPWDRWNKALHPLLVDSQKKDGPMAGTWDPRDQWEQSGGRIYSTALRILMLEIYYRHLPIYQVVE